MAQKITVSITRTSNYETEVADDFDPSAIDTDEIMHFVDKIGQAETDDIFVNALVILDSDNKIIFEDGEN